jgi:hypothetical protein
MRTFKVRQIVIACIAVYAMPFQVCAQPTADTAPPPPEMQKLEEGEAPAVTIRKPEERSKITEKRAPGGKVTEVKVTNGKSTYYLKPNDPAGSAAPGDAESNANRAAQWEVMQFDLGRRAQKEKEAQAAEETPAPPAAPTAPAARPAKK